MTVENYNYRTSQIMLRNQFPGKGKLQIPIIPKFQEKPGDFDDLLLIGFDKTHLEDQEHLNRMIHFFLYDYRFERVWKKPDNDIEKLSRYRAVLSPDFSMYLEMAPVMQLYNVFRNRWCGAYWASKGIRVIPTVNWGDESTFDFCFEGIEKGSVVAVSTYMASEHGNHQDQKEWFLAGYNEMLRRIQPEKIICYNTPFPEMQGNIIPVDYERSSWKYMSYHKGVEEDDLSAFQMGGTFQKECDILEAYRIGGTTKGGGSAYGGKWKPAKEDDERLIGEPGEIKVTFKKDGSKIETKIGPDGRAVKERHYTDHSQPGKHSNPHDHPINWESPRNGIPNFIKPHINYWPEDYPDVAPEFKALGVISMKRYFNTEEENRFKTISEFKDCIIRGCEVSFTWKGINYGIGDTEEGGVIYTIFYEAYRPETIQYCLTPDDVLNCVVGSDRLRDVITQVTVIDRSF